jgi:hypothetical protein
VHFYLDYSLKNIEKIIRESVKNCKAIVPKDNTYLPSLLFIPINMTDRQNIYSENAMGHTQYIHFHVLRGSVQSVTKINYEGMSLTPCIGLYMHNYAGYRLNAGYIFWFRKKYIHYYLAVLKISFLL